MGLPEEYIELFPVPYIVTQLGKAQSVPFFGKADGMEKRAAVERRRRPERRFEIRQLNTPHDRRRGIDRRCAAGAA